MQKYEEAEVTFFINMFRIWLIFFVIVEKKLALPYFKTT